MRWVNSTLMSMSLSLLTLVLFAQEPFGSTIGPRPAKGGCCLTALVTMRRARASLASSAGLGGFFQRSSLFIRCCGVSRIFYSSAAGTGPHPAA